MDNHLWEHEDIAGAKLIVCVWSAWQPGVCATGSGRPAVKPGYTYGSVFRRPVMDCSNRVFWSEKRIRVCIMYVQAFDHVIDLLRFDMLFVFSYSNLKSLLHKHTYTRANASRWVRMHSLAPSQHHLNVVHLKLVRPSLFQLTLFPLQLTASTWEMSGSLLPALFGLFKHLWSVKLISTA